MKNENHFGTMNDSKWRELQNAMYALNDLKPAWRTKDLETSHVSTWDKEWYYHFSEGGFKTIEWVDIKIESDSQRSLVRQELKKIHLPGLENEEGFRIFGWVPKGAVVGYI